MNVSSIGAYIREQREQAKISLRQLASAAGVSNPYLSQIERGLRRPSAEILQQIAKGLRISAEALYVQAGILEERHPDSGVRAAVLADPELGERQKQVLLEIYESFRRETGTNLADAAESVPESVVPGPGPAEGTRTGGRRRAGRKPDAEVSAPVPEGGPAPAGPDGVAARRAGPVPTGTGGAGPRDREDPHE